MVEWEYNYDNGEYYSAYYGYYQEPYFYSYYDSYYGSYSSYYYYYSYYYGDEYNNYYSYDGYYDYYDYYTYTYYGYYDSTYGINYAYTYGYSYTGDGNHDVEEKYLGGQDWDDWHEAGGQSKDDEWTGDINDFLQSGDDPHHRDTVWSFDDGDGPSFMDRMGEILTQEHEQHEVAHDLSWITWAKEDVDFWEWFWQWYGELDGTWNFDHEPGFVQMDHDYEWEWFQKHTGGFNETLDDLWIDRDDSE